MTQNNPTTVLLNDCEKSRKKRKNNCDIKFTELYLRFHFQNLVPESFPLLPLICRLLEDIRFPI